MSDLSDLAADVSKDLPAQVRKVIDTALEAGWSLNKPGMTLCLRLNHPSDDLADPVYITWVVGRTPTGRLSFRFDSCGTRGLVPLSGADLLEYLKDPTVAYPVTEELEAEQAAKEKEEDLPPWDTKISPEANVQAQLKAVPVKVEKASKTPEPSKPASPLRVNAPKLRIQAPSVSRQS